MCIWQFGHKLPLHCLECWTVHISVLEAAQLHWRPWVWIRSRRHSFRPWFFWIQATYCPWLPVKLKASGIILCHHLRKKPLAAFLICRYVICMSACVCLCMWVHVPCVRACWCWRTVDHAGCLSLPSPPLILGFHFLYLFGYFIHICKYILIISSPHPTALLRTPSHISLPTSCPYVFKPTSPVSIAHVGVAVGLYTKVWRTNQPVLILWKKSDCLAPNQLPEAA